MWGPLPFRRRARLAPSAPWSLRTEGRQMSSPSVRGTRRAGSAALAALLAFGLLLLGLAVPGVASADTRPDPGTPATVSADGLGTVQVNGVVWSMVTVGNTVYATGSFTNARPAGAAPGTSTTPRANLLAFNLTTGALITTFNHTLNGQGRHIAASPDGSRVYVAGDFTTVDGVARGHIAAFNIATGALITASRPPRTPPSTRWASPTPPSTPAATSPPRAASPAPGSPPSTRPTAPSPPGRRPPTTPSAASWSTPTDPGRLRRPVLPGQRAARGRPGLGERHQRSGHDPAAVRHHQRRRPRSASGASSTTASTPTRPPTASPSATSRASWRSSRTTSR